MTLCELCKLQLPDAGCLRGNRIPAKMKCVDFTPGLERFCASPTDRTNKTKFYEMALFFGLTGRELRRVKTM